MNESLGKLGSMLREIERIRDKVELQGASIRVVHGGLCQKEMQEIGNQLTDGATRYIGYFKCPEHDNTTIIIHILASPDTPFELSQQGKEKNE